MPQPTAVSSHALAEPPAGERQPEESGTRLLCAQGSLEPGACVVPPALGEGSLSLLEDDVRTRPLVGAGGSAGGFHVLGDYVEGLLQLFGQAELDDLGAGAEHRGVTRGNVLRIAGHKRLLARGGLERHSAGENVSPMGAWHLSSGSPVKNGDRSASALYVSKATV